MSSIELISIVIPTYNSSKVIHRCLNSVLKQEGINFEVICVDDGSRDNTVDKIQQWSKKHGSVQLQLITQENRGASAARNTGLAASLGSYIQFLDSDDVLLPEKLVHQTKMVKNSLNPVAFVAGSYIVVDQEGAPIEIVTIEQNNHALLNLMKGKLGITSSNLFRKEDVVNVSGWDDELQSSQEYDLMLRILKQSSGKVLYDNRPLTEIYKGRSDSISTRDPKGNYRRYFELRRKALEMAKKLDPGRINEYYQVLFDGIRVLYRIDPTTAIRVYRESIPKSFSPSFSETSSRKYLFLYKILGFPGADRLLNMFR